MKKILRRIGAVALAMVLLVSMALPAYATTYYTIQVQNLAAKQGQAENSTTSFSEVFDYVYTNYLSNNGTVTTSRNGPLAFSPGEIAQVNLQYPYEAEIGTGHESTGLEFNRPTRFYLTQSGTGDAIVASHTLVAPLTVNADLSIRSIRDDTRTHATLTLQQPITISNGATVLLDSIDNLSAKDSSFIPDKFVDAVSSGAAIVVNSGSKLRLGAVELEFSGATGPFVEADGGEVVIQKGSTPTKRDTTSVFVGEDEVNTNLSASLSATNVTQTVINAHDGATVTIKGGNISSSSADNSAIVLGSGANTLTLIGGTLSSSAGPVVTIPNGNTLVIPADSTATVTTEAANGHAIELAAGAIVKVGNTTITVASDAQDGTNYVDNDGVIILSAGAVVDGETLTTGGKVSRSNGTVTVTIPVTCVTVAPTAVTLGVGGKQTLTATVVPTDATNQTVNWSSSNETVATVEAGVVTANQAGTATITATVTDEGETYTSSCTVTVNPTTTTVTPSAAAYRVEHYQQNLDGSYTLAETDFPLYGALNSTVTAEAKTYDHYHLNSDESTASGTVVMPTEADGAVQVLTLQLYYDRNEYTVTFNSAGGTSVDKKPVQYEGTVDEPASPTRPGYTFAGWTLDGERYDFDTKITDNIELTATWNEKVVVTSGTTTTANNNKTNTTETLPTETDETANAQVGEQAEVVSTETVTDEETGTVTTTTEKSDGSTTVVEKTTDGTITTTDKAATGVQVVTVEAPSQQVKATVTIPE